MSYVAHKYLIILMLFITFDPQEDICNMFNVAQKYSIILMFHMTFDLQDEC